MKTGIEEVPSENVGMLETGFGGIPEVAALGAGVVDGIEEEVFDGFKVAGAECGVEELIGVSFAAGVGTSAGAALLSEVFVSSASLYSFSSAP